MLFASLFFLVLLFAGTVSAVKVSPLLPPDLYSGNGSVAGSGSLSRVFSFPGLSVSGDPVWSAYNARQKVSIAATGSGTVLVAGANGSFSMQLAGIGRSGAVQPVLPGTNDVKGTRLDILRPGFDEWYVSRDTGIEQGMTITVRPEGSGSVHVSYSLSGDLKPVLTGPTLMFFDKHGPVMQYTGLSAHDAAGRALPAKMTLSGNLLSWQIDDRDAVYPVTIDPTIDAQAEILPNPDQVLNAQFGYSVSVYNDTMVVGVPGTYGSGGAGTPSGVAYVFKEIGGIWSPTPVVTLEAPDQVDDNISFGYSVSVYNDTIVVGAPYADGTLEAGSDAGEAYIFKETGGIWSPTPVVTLEAPVPDQVDYANFGYSVSVYNDTVVVGAEGANGNLGQGSDAGEAYVFKETGGIWSSTPVVTLEAPDQANGAIFGNSVSVYNDTIVVGAYYADGNLGQGSDAGEAYIFKETGGIWSPTSVVTLEAPDQANGAIFGNSVSVFNDTVVVGATGARSNAGEAYIFKETGGIWSPTSVVTLEAPVPDQVESASFGESVSVFNDTVVVGATGVRSNTGEAYVFKETGGIWSPTPVLTLEAPDQANGAIFGNSISVYNDTIVVGAPYANSIIGETYVFLSDNLPVASFSANPITGAVPLTVHFTDTSSGSPTGRAWFFGDENYTEPWTELNASAGWPARNNQSSVVMPDGSIVLMGGCDGTNFYNDTWQSPPGSDGATWTEVNASAGWQARYGQSSVVMPDGSIVLMGGYDGTNFYNDVWQSWDDGATWWEVNANAGWTPRYGQSSVVMPDGSIVLMGGYDDTGNLDSDVWQSPSGSDGATWIEMTTANGWSGGRYDQSSVVMPDGSIVLMGGYNPNGPDAAPFNGAEEDVWQSPPGFDGATWTQLVTYPALWTPRYGQSSVAMPDGSIVLMGGYDSTGHLDNDVWQSLPGSDGAAWTEVNTSAGFSGRYGQSSVAMPDGSIVLMGGYNNTGYFDNETWQFNPVGSSLVNPSHTYTVPGTYPVALQAYNSLEYNSTLLPGYITVAAAGFTANVTFGTPPLTVQFYDTSTGSPEMWNWSFGDGNWFNTTSAAQKNPVHKYENPGNFDVSLNATYAYGSNTTIRTNYINVTGPRPIPNFIANVTTGPAPLPVLFTNQSSNNPTGWAWFFGDENYTEPWTEMTSTWFGYGRSLFSSVAMPDGSIVLMGGFTDINGYVEYDLNDVWRSIDGGATWTEVNPSAEWTARNEFSSVVMPDNSIVLMGGQDSNGPEDDVWQSPDAGETWSLVNTSSNNNMWSPRFSQSSVVMPDGSIILMGGDTYSGYKNDVWQSPPGSDGATWNEVTQNAPWSARMDFSSVAMPDGSIVLMGGYNGTNFYNDVWQSPPGSDGATWNEVTQNAPWSARNLLSCVAMPDGSIVLMGGGYNDIWRSTDDGATWMNITPSVGWAEIWGQSSVAMPDGSIVMMGSGYDYVWRLQPAGSSSQNPSHTYTSPGIYNVTLQAFNTGGYNSTEKTGYITVTSASGSPYYTVATSIGQGATVYIGEQGLNLTHAFNAAQGFPAPVADSNTPVTSNMTIGWWALSANIQTTPPYQTISLGSSYRSFTVAPSAFDGYTGVWYLVNPSTGRAWITGSGSTATAIPVINVQDPSLDLGVWDFTLGTDVTGQSVSQGDSLGFTISTNMAGSLNATYRSPVYNSTADGYIDINVTTPAGTSLASLLDYGGSAHSILQQNVSFQPWVWGNVPSAPVAWSTNVRNGSGNYDYPAGTYSVWAESGLNNMRTNYQNGGADYTGKTVSPVYSITLTSGGSAPVASFTTNVTAGVVPLAVQFSDTSTGTNITRNWSFGDGYYSTDQAPVHTFSQSQVFNVTLTVTNGAGLSNSTMQQVTVNAAQIATTSALNGTTITSAANTPQSLAINGTDLQNTGGSVTNTSTTATITGGNTFWQSVVIYAESVAVNTTSGNNTVTATNVNQAVMQSTPVTAALNQSIGTVSVSLAVALNQYVSNAPVNITITQGATTNTVNAFQLAAQNSSISIGSIAYTVNFTNTETINNNLTRNTTQQTVVVTMSVNHTWVAQYDNGTNDYGRDNITVLRYPESGDPQVLKTWFDHYDATTNMDWFEADSPNGLSIFGLVEYAAQQAAASQQAVSGPGSGSSQGGGNRGSGYNAPDDDPQEAEPPAPVQAAPPGSQQQAGAMSIVASPATLPVDGSGLLTASLGVQSPDKTALLALPAGLRATNSAGQTLSVISIQQLDSSNDPATGDNSIYTLAGPVYQCGPDGAQFAPAITLTVTLTATQWDSVNANGMQPVIRSYSPATNTWTTLATQSNAGTRTLSAPVSHFSDFAVFTQPVSQPTEATPLSAPTDPYDIILSMFVWVAGVLEKNPIIAAICGVLLCAVPITWWWYRRKKMYDRIFN